MNYILLIVIVLHLVVGFGWLIYKIGFQKTKPKMEDQDKKHPSLRLK